MTTKTYTLRDSATSALRKAGFTKADYAARITASGGKFTVNFGDLSKPAPSAIARIANPAPAPDAKPAVKTTHKLAGEQLSRTVSSACRELILAGKSNADVFAAVQKEFNLDDSKKAYPSWYRAELRRKGLVK